MIQPWYDIKPFTGRAFALIFMMHLFGSSLAQKSFDSLRIKQAKHYFNTVIVADVYRKPNKTFTDTSDALSKRLKSYGVKQTNIYFHTPLYTHDQISKDSGIIKNTHLLLTGNLVSLKPVFDGIEQHHLIKFGVGMRFIYNTGKKGLWFVDLSPFVTRDISDRSKAYYRMASTIVFSYNVSDKLNWRIGATKSFLWGNRFYLPFIGFRIGRLDKTHLSIQFPRSISLNIPARDKVLLSVYSRPQGGMYNFSNADSLYFKSSVSTFHFTRFELNTGLRCDVRLNTHFNFYLATGISSRNSIYFYSDNANRARKGTYSTYFYSKKTDPSLFVNLGLVLVFGKTKASYFDKNMYDAIDLANTMDPNGNGNAEIPLSPKKKNSDKNLKAIADLIDYNDF